MFVRRDLLACSVLRAQFCKVFMFETYFLVPVVVMATEVMSVLTTAVPLNLSNILVCELLLTVPKNI